MSQNDGSRNRNLRSASTLVILLILLSSFVPAVSAGLPSGTGNPKAGGSGSLPRPQSMGWGGLGLSSSAPQGTLVRALTAEPNSLDLPLASDGQARAAAWQLYDSLVWVDDTGWVVPALAESWAISNDGTEYTFQLRQGVTFHNGEPFNADAVVFSWERASQGDLPGSYAWQEATSVVKTGDYTVVVTTEAPDGSFLRTVANAWAMIPPLYFQAVGQAGFEAHPIGTGPFAFVEWIAGDHITMQANPSYWRDGLPKLQSVVFRFIEEPADRVDALLTGSVDIITRLSLEEAQGLIGVDGVKIVAYPLDRVYYVAFNNLTTGVGQPTENALVRQAMNYAVDVRSIIDTYFGGLARESTGLVTPANLGYDNGKPFGYDPGKASSLLSAAGYGDGFAMDMACPAGAYAHFEEVCDSVAQHLGAVGIDVTLELMDPGTFWDLEAQKLLPPLFGDSWSAHLGDPLPRLRGALDGWDAAYSAWSDPAIDALLDAIEVETDQVERAALYGQLQQYMRDEPPFIYLYEPFAFEAIDVAVVDYKPRASEEYFLMATWLDSDADGVPETVEDGAPNDGDGNADGVADREQENVASLPNVIDGAYLTLESPDGTQLNSVLTLANPSPADAPPSSFPLGFVAFDVLGIEPGSSVIVTLTLPLEPEIGTYWRYGPTLDDPSEHWYRFTFDGTTGAEIDHELEQTRISLHLVDGGRGDGNLVADGQIVDPGAPGVILNMIYLPVVLRNH